MCTFQLGNFTGWGSEGVNVKTEFTPFIVLVFVCFFGDIILHVNCFGSTVLHTCIRYCV